MDFDDDWSDDDDEAEAEAGPSGAPKATAKELSADDELAKLRAEVAALRTVVNRTLETEEGKGKERDDDTGYFDTYAANDIHEVMLKDTTRTVSYARFILSNPKVFKDAIVMDVGAGTGILSSELWAEFSKLTCSVCCSCRREARLRHRGIWAR
jgi:protein arginine N-methyltransferase 3